MTRDYRYTFKCFFSSKLDQNFISCGQTLDLLNRSRKRIVKQHRFLEEKDEESLWRYESLQACTLMFLFLWRKVIFEQIAMRMAKSKVDLKPEIFDRQQPSDDIEHFVLAETFNPFIDIGQMCVRFEAKEIFIFPAFKSDPFARMARFDYSTLFVLLAWRLKNATPISSRTSVLADRWPEIWSSSIWTVTWLFWQSVTFLNRPSCYWACPWWNGHNRCEFSWASQTGVHSFCVQVVLLVSWPCFSVCAICTTWFFCTSLCCRLQKLTLCRVTCYRGKLRALASRTVDQSQSVCWACWRFSRSDHSNGS